jgi:hypothetical protein
MRSLISIAVISVWLAAPAYAEDRWAIGGDPFSLPTNVIARAWSDPDFKARLLSDPHAALAEFGLKVDDGTEVKVVENMPGTKHVVLPMPPKNVSELSSEELENIAADHIGFPTGPQVWNDGS